MRLTARAVESEYWYIFFNISNFQKRQKIKFLSFC